MGQRGRFGIQCGLLIMQRKAAGGKCLRIDGIEKMLVVTLRAEECNFHD